MKKIVSVIVFLFSTSLLANDINLSLSVDSTSISVGEQIEVKVKVEGSSELSSWPRIAGVRDFDVQNGGSASQIQIINGRMSRARTFTLYLTPSKPGSFTIGPAQVEVRGQNFKSNTLRLIVAKQGTKPSSEKNYFVEASVDKARPFAGEQINYYLRFYIRNVDRGNANVEFPDFSGDFWKEEVKDNQREYRRNIDGVVWNVTEVKIALFPLRPGKILLGAAKLQVPIAVPNKRRRNHSLLGSFFGEPRQTKVVTLSTNKVELEVQDLPAVGKPENFSGLVGDFKLSGRLTKTELSVGGSATLTLRVVGEGHIRGLKMPKINTADFKIYEDKPQTAIEKDEDRVIAFKEWNVALVPQKEGDFNLGPIDLWFFNTETKKYQKSSTGDLVVKVSPGAGEESINHVATSSSFRKQKVTQLGEDLRPIKRDLADFNNKSVGFGERFFSLFSIVILPFIYFVFVRIRARKLRLQSDSSILRREKAYKNFVAGSKKISVEKIYEQCSQLLRTYIGDRLKIDGLALTPLEVEKLLRAQNVSSELINICTKYLKQCDMGAYGGQKTSADEMKSKLNEIGRKLEKELV